MNGTEHLAISIIMPAYNAGKFIDRAIKSVLDQSFENWELIIVDDGSTDNTAEICDEIAKKDSRIICIHQDNSGQGIARNRGVKESKGDFICFLDSDDWFDIEALSDLYDCAERTGADIVFFDHYVIELEDGCEVSRRWDRLNAFLDGPVNCINHPELICSLQGGVWDKMYKRELLHDVAQPSHPYEDTAILPIILSSANKIVQLRKPLYYYLCNRADSTTNISKNVVYLLDSAKFVYDYFQKNDFDLYKDSLRKYTEFMYLVARNHVERCNGDAPDKEQYVKFLENFRDKIIEWYPDSGKILDAKIVVLGSYNARCVANRARRNLVLPIAWEKRYLDTDFESLPIGDFIVVDCLEESFFDGAELGTKKKSYMAFIEYIKNKYEPSQIILLKNYLCEGFGYYGEDLKYEELDSIITTNKVLAGLYDYLVEELSGISVIEACEKRLSFTAEDYPHGCLPWHQNEYVYAKIENELEKTILKPLK
ncbi:glycosyltransferase family 2 protein [Butyrivibrio sp. VCD2006]|uniref:glycosyltransferase family 2 protein n=1 Tax=Butyrivibrio sp. VCD2006 TaxID=1280664 RepID=UPI0003FD2009|nr:glycosyltransferase family 2 protein [Butyrivibrio sp. VCD2006]